jgi:RNA polymerase sigma factor (sigma-70 family)
LSGKSKYNDEEVLLSDLKSGDNEAFRFLVDQYHLKILRTCKGFMRSDADADDIAQDVFVEIYRSISKFRGNSALSTWIYKIAVNKSLNALRSASRRKMFSFSSEGDGREEYRNPEREAGEDSRADKGVERQEQSEALDKALAALPEKQRTAFVLHRYDDLPYKEIAEVMGVTLGSVESLIYRARQGLQKSLYGFYKSSIDQSIAESGDS